MTPLRQRDMRSLVSALACAERWTESVLASLAGCRAPEDRRQAARERAALTRYRGLRVHLEIEMAAGRRRRRI